MHPSWTHRAAPLPFGVEFIAQGRVTQGRQIGAGAKIAARTGQDRHPQGVIRLKALKRRPQLCGDGAVDGVALVGSVQCDGANCLIDVHIDVLHVHGRCLGKKN